MTKLVFSIGTLILFAFFSSCDAINNDGGDKNTNIPPVNLGGKVDNGGVSPFQFGETNTPVKVNER